MEEEYGVEMRLIDPQDVNESDQQMLIQDNAMETGDNQQVEIINIDGSHYNVSLRYLVDKRWNFLTGI